MTVDKPKRGFSMDPARACQVGWRSRLLADPEDG
jgi:hypothetical protein